jgi:hypothetical protein
MRRAFFPSGVMPSSATPTNPANSDAEDDPLLKSLNEKQRMAEEQAHLPGWKEDMDLVYVFLQRIFYYLHLGKSTK